MVNEFVGVVCLFAFSAKGATARSTGLYLQRRIFLSDVVYPTSDKNIRRRTSSSDVV
jgi:hypothetical protein